MTVTLERLNLCLYCDNMTGTKPRPDPFDSVVFGDNSPVTICDSCYQDRQDQV